MTNIKTSEVIGATPQQYFLKTNSACKTVKKLKRANCSLIRIWIAPFLYLLSAHFKFDANLQRAASVLFATGTRRGYKIEDGELSSFRDFQLSFL